jgi:Protein of unknown function (DUF3604)
VKGELELADRPAGLELPERVDFEPRHAGRLAFQGVAREPGVYRLSARIGTLSAESNPLVVSANAPRVLWGDLHGHSNYSDGTGLPEDYFVYARDVSDLDVSALTDHDHWGVLPLATHPRMWEDIERATERFNDPGHFVTLLGFEWTNWIHGHRHVLFFGDRGDIRDALDPDVGTPDALWRSLDGQRAMTIAHHPAGGPVPTNWDFAPDPRFETLVEIVSIHGSSEAEDTPGRIRKAHPGSYVRDALARGYHLGFIGSGDRHDGHPGVYQVDPIQGGLAGILAEERTREAVWDALRARRVYATNGARIVLRLELAGRPMGAEVSLASATPGPLPLSLSVVAEAPLDRVDLIRSGAVVERIDAEGRLQLDLQRELEGIAPGEYVYVRVVQRNLGTAWSSPVYFVD